VTACSRRLPWRGIRFLPTREVAQIAASLGRQFSHELINAIAMMPKQQLDEALAQLVQAELIFRRGTPPQCGIHFQACAGAGCRLQPETKLLQRQRPVSALSRR